MRFSATNAATRGTRAGGDPRLQTSGRVCARANGRGSRARGGRSRDGERGGGARARRRSSRAGTRLVRFSRVATTRRHGSRLGFAASAGVHGRAQTHDGPRRVAEIARFYGERCKAAREEVVAAERRRRDIQRALSARRGVARSTLVDDEDARAAKSPTFFPLAPSPPPTEHFGCLSAFVARAIPACAALVAADERRQKRVQSETGSTPVSDVAAAMTSFGVPDALLAVPSFADATTRRDARALLVAIVHASPPRVVDAVSATLHTRAMAADEGGRRRLGRLSRRFRFRFRDARRRLRDARGFGVGGAVGRRRRGRRRRGRRLAVFLGRRARRGRAPSRRSRATRRDRRGRRPSGERRRRRRDGDGFEPDPSRIFTRKPNPQEWFRAHRRRPSGDSATPPPRARRWRWRGRERPDAVRMSDSSGASAPSGPCAGPSICRGPAARALLASAKPLPRRSSTSSSLSTSTDVAVGAIDSTPAPAVTKAAIRLGRRWREVAARRRRRAGLVGVGGFGSAVSVAERTVDDETRTEMVVDAEWREGYDADDLSAVRGAGAWALELLLASDSGGCSRRIRGDASTSLRRRRTPTFRHPRASMFGDFRGEPRAPAVADDFFDALSRVAGDDPVAWRFLARRGALDAAPRN